MKAVVLLFFFCEKKSKNHSQTLTGSHFTQM